MSARYAGPDDRVAYNATMDGVQCARCRHGREDHGTDADGGPGGCVERDEVGTGHVCPCPEFVTGHRGQQGSEAGCYS